MESQAGFERPNVKRKGRITVIQHKWTPIEITTLLNCLHDSVLKNEGIEKPTASIYYGGILCKLDWKHLTPLQAKNKVADQKSKYLKTIDWRNQTGQGVLENSGEAAVRDYILRLCPNFDLIDEIFGTRANVVPPFVHDTGSQATATSTQDFEVVSYNSQAKDDHSPRPISEPPSPHWDSDYSSNVQTIKTKLEAKPERKRKDAWSGLSECHKQRAEGALKKLAVEERRLESETLWRQQELNLSEKRLETEKELRLLEMEKDERIARFKIEQECKLQLDFAKLRQV